MTRVRQGFLALGFLLLASSARADMSSSAAAELMFQEGRTLMNQGKYADACNRFSRSNQVDPAVGTLLNLADCYKHLGKTASAWGAFRDAVTLANARRDEKRAAIAQDEARELEANLPRVKIEFAGTTPGLSVLLNGEAVDQANFASPMPVDPGEHTVDASAPGRISWHTTVTIPEGTTKTIVIPKLEPSSSGFTLANGLELGGGIALGAAVVTGIIAVVKWNSVEEACPDRQCPSSKTRTEQEGAADASRTFGTVSTVTALVGVAALGLGLYLDFGRSKKVAVGVNGPTVALRAAW